MFCPSQNITEGHALLLVILTLIKVVSVKFFLSEVTIIPFELMEMVWDCAKTLFLLKLLPNDFSIYLT